jgi:hypothetical protein
MVYDKFMDFIHKARGSKIEFFLSRQVSSDWNTLSKDLVKDLKRMEATNAK